MYVLFYTSCLLQFPIFNYILNASFEEYHFIWSLKCICMITSTWKLLVKCYALFIINRTVNK